MVGCWVRIWFSLEVSIVSGPGNTLNIWFVEDIERGAIVTGACVVQPTGTVQNVSASICNGQIKRYIVCHYSISVIKQQWIEKMM